MDNDDQNKPKQRSWREWGDHHNWLGLWLTILFGVIGTVGVFFSLPADFKIAFEGYVQQIIHHAAPGKEVNGKLNADTPVCPDIAFDYVDSNPPINCLWRE